MTAAIYARYSSSEQAGTLTIESQVRACKEYALSRGWRIFDTYVDRSIAGSRDQSRPDFQRMISDAQRKPRPFETILVWKYSRFFRDRHKSAVYKGLLHQHGVDVVSVTEHVEKDSASGVLMEGMIEVIDQFYSARLSEETRRGLKENTLAGYRTGSVAPYGYARRRLDVQGGKPKTVIVPDPKTSLIARRIFEEYAGGQKGLKRIAVGLNREGIQGPRGGSWDPSTLRAILKNETYLGWGVLGKTRRVLQPNDHMARINNPRASWVVNESAHEPLIDRKTWNKVQAQFERAHQPQLIGAPKAKARYLLAGILRCGVCGGNYVTYKRQKQDGSRWALYTCGTRQRSGAVACGNKLEIPHEPFNRRIVEYLVDLLAGGEYLDEIAKRVNEKIQSMAITSEPRLAELRKEIVAVHRRLSLCVDAVLNGEFESVKERMIQLEARQEALRTELAQQERAANTRQYEITKSQVQAAQKAITDELAESDSAELRSALLAIFDGIKIYPSGKLEFHFKPEGLFPASPAILQHGVCTDPGFTHVEEFGSLVG